MDQETIALAQAGTRDVLLAPSHERAVRAYVRNHNLGLDWPDAAPGSKVKASGSP